MSEISRNKLRLSKSYVKSYQVQVLYGIQEIKHRSTEVLVKCITLYKIKAVEKRQHLSPDWIF